jgi:hypothetical protein
MYEVAQTLLYICKQEIHLMSLKHRSRYVKCRLGVSLILIFPQDPCTTQEALHRLLQGGSGSALAAACQNRIRVSFGGENHPTHASISRAPGGITLTRSMVSLGQISITSLGSFFSGWLRRVTLGGSSFEGQIFVFRLKCDQNHENVGDLCCYEGL